MPSLIRIVGMDPSMRNWGLAFGTLDVDTLAITIDRLDAIHTKPDSSKQVRQNSKDLATSRELFAGVRQACEGAQAIFVEVPHGSQSASAMKGYGLCMGVLGALRASEIQFHEVTAGEVKHMVTGRKEATKREVINWAGTRHPDINWPTQTKKGELLLVESKAEHMADAIVAIYAGVQTASFQSLLPMMRLMTKGDMAIVH